MWPEMTDEQLRNEALFIGTVDPDTYIKERREMERAEQADYQASLEPGRLVIAKRNRERRERKHKKQDLKERQRAHERKRLDRQEAIWDAADKVREAVQEQANGEEDAADFDALTPEVVLTETEKLPALWKRDDGETLLYAGRVNALYGLPSVGKSWLALMVAISAIKKGGNVLWLDFEDRPNTLARRAALLGGLQYVIDRDKFRFGIPELSESEPALESALEWLKEGNENSLVVIDSCESAGAPSDGQPIDDFFDKYVERWKKAEIGVCLLDHIPKRSQDRPKGPIGSVHKLSRLDGAALVVSGQPWSKTTNGQLKLVVEKDRHGDLPAPFGKTATLVKGEYKTVDGERTFAYYVTIDGEANEQTIDDTALAGIPHIGSLQAQWAAQTR